MTPNGTLDREGDGGRASHTVFVCVSEFVTRGLDEAGSGHWRRGFLPTGEQPKRSVPGRCAAPRALVPLETSWHLSMSPPRTPPRLSPCPQPAPGAPGHDYLWEAQTVSAMREASRRKQKPTGGASVLSSCNVSISKRHRSEERGPPARVCGQWGKFSPWQPVRAQLQISSRSFFSLNRPPISTSEMQIYPGKLCLYLLNLATLPTMPERQF